MVDDTFGSHQIPATGISQPRFQSFESCPLYKDSGVKWLGNVPAHWAVRRLKYSAPIRASKLDRKAADAIYVGLEHIESWTGRLLLNNQPDTVDSVVTSFRTGDVFFGKLRPYLAKSARPDFGGVATSEILVLRPHGDCLQSYVMYSLLNEPFVRWINVFTYGAKMPRVSPDQVAISFMPVPPLPEQRAIAGFLDRETAKIDTLVAKKERLIELLQEKRIALIGRAVTKGLDPNVPMKDSGVEWLGEMPAHWEVKRLWHLTPSDRRIMYGIVLPGPHVEDGIPIVKGGDVSSERLRLDRLNRTARAIESRYARSRLHVGDLVYAIRGSIGDAAMIPTELEGANLTQDAARVAYKENSHGWWLLYVLESRAVFTQLEAGARGATIRGINIRDLKRALIPVPPLSEQQGIAEYVRRETEKIDTLISKVGEAIDRLTELRAALISAAVTGRIDVREEVA